MRIPTKPVRIDLALYNRIKLYLKNHPEEESIRKFVEKIVGLYLDGLLVRKK